MASHRTPASFSGGSQASSSGTAAWKTGETGSLVASAWGVATAPDGESWGSSPGGEVPPHLHQHLPGAAASPSRFLVG